MKKLILTLALSITLTGFAEFALSQILPMPSAPDAGTATSAPNSARRGHYTVEKFDTTNAEDRDEAVISALLSQGTLGQPIAMVGEPAAPRFWGNVPLFVGTRLSDAA